MNRKDKIDRTNRILARNVGCTPRQISKSRRRGWIWLDGEKKKYKAPEPVQITLKALPKRKSK